MNKVLLIIATAITLTVAAQTALSPRSPAIPASPGLAISPGTLAATPSGFTNSLNTNPLAIQLAPLLTNLQVVIEQVLPTLTEFNDGFDFVDTTGTGVASQSAPSTAGPTATPGASSGQGTPGLGGLGVALSPGTVVTNATSAAPTAPTGFASFPTARDTLRRLLVLQAQLEQVLPMLNAVNNGNAGVATNRFGFPLINPPNTGTPSGL